jgi:hypothetical protein
MYKQVRDALIKAGDSGTMVTDVYMWGYTQDGIRELPTEVRIKIGGERGIELLTHLTYGKYDE